MAKIPFTEYMHGSSDHYETAMYIYGQLGGQDATGMDEDAFAEVFGRPFYEVELKCEFDTVTHETTIVSAKTCNAVYRTCF